MIGVEEEEKSSLSEFPQIKKTHAPGGIINKTTPSSVAVPNLDKKILDFEQML